MLEKNEAILMIQASERDANLYYATRFLAPDPFIFLEVKGRKILLMNELELDRARKEADVDEVIPTQQIVAQMKKQGLSPKGGIDLICWVMEKRGVKKLLVPYDFPVAHADALRKKGYFIRSKSEPFYEQRTIKTSSEIKSIEESIHHTERAVARAVDILKHSKINGKYLYYQKKRLTSETIKQEINVSLMESGCIAAHTIVSCGRQCVDPHDRGSGPLLAHESIIMDVFPRSDASRYFADMTRTVVRGKANEKLKCMYQAVLEGQRIAFRSIRDGADGKTIHDAILKYFESLGFKSGMIDGRMQGFFHGTGHGVGLDIHEAPRISSVHDRLKKGHVVTVEPGLYYLDAGGVRLEDIVVVTKSGCRNLNRFPKVLEI